MQLSSLVCNMEITLTDIVYSNTYGSDPWLMQLHKILFIAKDLYSHGKESAYNTTSHEARVKYNNAFLGTI